MGRLDDGIEQVGPDRPDAGHFLKLLDLRILASEPFHLGLRLGLRFEGKIQHPVEAPKLLGDLGAVEATEIVLPPLLGVDPLPFNIQDAPAAEGRLDLLLESHLLFAQGQVALGSCLEDSPSVIRGVVDFLKVPESKESAKVVGVGLVALVRVAAQKLVLSRIANEDLLDVGIQSAGRPAGERRGLQSKPLCVRFDRGDSRNQLCFGRREFLVALKGAVPVHHAEGAGVCMEVEAKVCCSHEDVVWWLNGICSLQIRHHRRPLSM